MIDNYIFTRKLKVKYKEFIFVQHLMCLFAKAVYNPEITIEGEIIVL